MAFENVAYNLERYNYDNKNVQNGINKDDLVVVKSKKKKISFKVKALCYIMGLSLLVIIISTQVAINEVSQNILSANKVLDEVKSENVKLNIALEAKGSKRNIEEKAGAMFGLSEENRGQVEYINIKKENRAVVNTKNLGFFNKIYNTFCNIVEYIQNIFNNN